MRHRWIIAPLVTIFIGACGSSPNGQTGVQVALDSAPEATTDDSTTTVAPPMTAPEGATLAADGTIEIAVVVGTDDYETLGGDRVVTVALGSSVRITITDPSQDQEYHLHTFDVSTSAMKGEPGTISLVVGQIGRFDVESHVSFQTLLALVVQ